MTALKYVSIAAGCGGLGCKMCEGECDTDSDCITGLVCFQRTDITVNIATPGCKGWTPKDRDYCNSVDSKNKNELPHSASD